MKLIVVSICKDEAKTIGELLDRIPASIPGVTKIEKWVIDDGSTDGTADVAKKHGAKVRGGTLSKKLAFRFREAVDLALSRDADIMVNIDGDLQFAPEDIPKFVKPIVKDEADFVAADRFTNPETGELYRPENMPVGKYYGNKLGSWVTGKLSGQKFRDVTCGFRAYNRRALIAVNTNGTHTYTQETFQVLAMKRVRIQSMPVMVKYYPDRVSRVVTSIPSYILISAFNILRSFRDFSPLRFFGMLGLVPAVVGVPCVIFTLVHWSSTGSFSPYKFVGFLGVYTLSVALFLWSIGILADMQVRVLNNQEKIFESIKDLKYPKKEES